jgi:transcription elongation factor GreA
VEIQDLDNEASYTYMLVGTEESDPKENKISISSPMGKALVGKSAGEEVSVRTPKRVRRVKILTISAQH